MNPRTNAWTSTLVALLTLAGCVAAGSITALNPLTGERREFDSAETVPDGWIVCADADACPPARDCDELDEGACLTRGDCSPVYVGIGAYPRECETEDPPPALCDGEAFAGCTDAAATCDADACGPAPLGATYLCSDGSVGGVTGRCVMGRDATCGWEIRECPAPRPDECAPAECGPAPGAPAITCADGTIGGNTGRCLRDADGACGWEIRECPPADCSADECGPPSRAPLYVCWDGSLGGNIGVCERDDAGACGWVFRDCPPMPPRECEVEDCGPPLRAPIFECWDGSLGGNIGLCEPNADGMCAWVLRECPPEPCPVVGCDLECPAGFAHPTGADGCVDTCECVPTECGADECGPGLGAPAYECWDGSLGGNIGLCERDPDGVCGWVLRECPPETCDDADCGPPLRAPTFECADGSIGGNTGRCLREADGTCAWELRECPDPCADIPACRLACPEGQHHPTNADGCLLTCECVPDDGRS